MGLIRSRRRGALLLILVILAGWLRVWHIGANSLWFDEVFSRNVAVQSDLWSLARDGVAGDVHPPLYFMMLNVWEHLMGDSEMALRMLGALLALLTVPAFYHLGRLMFGERAGLIALGLGTVAPFQIYYAQEARQYALSITCAAWMGVGLIALLRGKRYGGLLYVIAAVAGLYTHYFIGLLLIALHLWIVFYGPARAQWRRWLLADVAIALLFVPQGLIFLQQTQAVLGGFWIVKPSIAAPIATLTFLMFSTILPPGVRELAEVLVVCVLVIAAVDIGRRAPKTVRAYWLLCLIALFGTLIPALIFSLVRTPLYLDRSFGLLAPFLIVLIAGALAYVPRTSPLPLLTRLLVIMLIGGVLLNVVAPDAEKPPYRKIAADLQAHPDALTVPILHLNDSTYLSLSYYAPDLDQRLGDLQAHSWLFPKTWQIFGVKRLSRAELDSWLSTYHGTVRLIASANTEAPGLDLLTEVRRTSCTEQITSYAPYLSVYEETLGPCLALHH